MPGIAGAFRLDFLAACPNSFGAVLVSHHPAEGESRRLPSPRRSPQRCATDAGLTAAAGPCGKTVWSQSKGRSTAGRAHIDSRTDQLFAELLWSQVRQMPATVPDVHVGPLPCQALDQDRAVHPLMNRTSM